MRPLRRSVRIPLSVRVMIRLPNDSEMECETVLLSRYGAKLRMRPFERPLVSEDHVHVCLRGSHTWRPARVAWTDRTAGYFAIELQAADNFWGVYFPDKVPEQLASNSSLPRYTPIAARKWN